MGYSNRIRPKREHVGGVTVPRGRRLIHLSDALGQCSACKHQFAVKADDSIEAQFDRHRCKQGDESQNELRVVREATENK